MLTRRKRRVTMSKGDSDSCGRSFVVVVVVVLGRRFVVVLIVGVRNCGGGHSYRGGCSYSCDRSCGGLAFAAVVVVPVVVAVVVVR